LIHEIKHDGLATIYQGGKKMAPFSTMKRIATAVLRSEQLLAEIREGIAKQSRTEQTLAEIREGVANLGRAEPLLAEIRDEMRLLNQNLTRLGAEKEPLWERILATRKTLG
jgi:hypothetical protein